MVVNPPVYDRVSAFFDVELPRKMNISNIQEVFLHGKISNCETPKKKMLVHGSELTPRVWLCSK